MTLLPHCSGNNTGVRIKLLILVHRTQQMTDTKQTILEDYCYRLNCVPPRIRVKAPIPNVMKFGGGGLWEVIGFR